ncbi:MAG: Subtilisin-like protein serine protease [candidate division Zixibacteria bacterium RBG-1]|nr:MAG: Subtilisin-like protein serine protease [candidate division Zixibacteria bacterium RBG-1]
MTTDFHIVSRMKNRKIKMKPFTKFYLSILYLSFSFTAPWSADSNTPAPTLVSAKDHPTVSGRLQGLIASENPNEILKIWVYFTDKGIFEEKGYLGKLQEQKQILLPKNLSRRAKSKEKEVVDFYDLPVYSSYIKQVTQLGAKLNYVSRWLNAASFYVPVGKIESISILGFIKSIKPVEILVRQPEPIEESQVEAEVIKTLGGTALNYGPSLNQLQLLNIPAVHSLGFKGQGVLVCMMDTGFRKNHQAFQIAYNEGRVLDEYDFINHDNNVQDDSADSPGQHSHGTSCWSILGGEKDGTLYGPAFKADFILAKTEYVPTETRIEEDNWVAGAEWADSLGADIISSSLGYYDFPQNPDTFSYTYSDLNGDVAVTTIAADVAASKGILVSNAMGNSGPGAGSLITPADADSIIACGAVDSFGVIVGFSSRGPTSDGRIKPELVAQGSSVYKASSLDTLTYNRGGGTSFATPLLGGCAAVLLSARPNLNNMQVREAMMESANNVGSPNNNYGWGMPDMLLALRYSFINGDVNTDNNINLADIISLVNYFFKGGLAPHPVKVGDVNCDTSVGLTDIVYLVNYVFKSGPFPC